MTKFFYTLLLCLGCSIGKASVPLETEKYFVFFKTWNLLKYNHEKFTTGKLDADSFFLAELPKFEIVKTHKEFNIQLAQFVPGAGSMVPNPLLPGVQLSGLRRANPRHRWLVESRVLDQQLKHLLLGVYNARETTGKHYVPERHYFTQIPNERKYVYPAKENLPEAMRLLALAKLQGVIDYLYPHHGLMKEAWDVVIRRNIPLFRDCGSRKDYEMLLLQLVANLNDSHSYNRFYSDLSFKAEIFGNAFYPPFDYRIMDDRILVTGLISPVRCEKAGINVGDWITAINGKKVGARIDKLSGLLSASNRNKLVSNLNDFGANLIWGLHVPHVELKIRSGWGERSVQVDFLAGNDAKSLESLKKYFREKAKRAEAPKAFKIIDGQIGYFDIDHIEQLVQHVDEDKFDGHIDSILNLAAAQRGLIFDMRGYPKWGGLVYTYLYKKFGKADQRFARYFGADLNNIGTFKWFNSQEVYNKQDVVLEGAVYHGKVAILVDPRTHSLSEWSTMSLQTMFPQSITIGEQSSGADGDEKYLEVPGNCRVYFTGNAIYYPDGTSAQGKGVRIDRKIIYTKTDVLEKKDVALAAAISELTKK